MVSYIDTKIHTAGPDHLGDMNDHVAIFPAYVRPMVYIVITRKNFNPADGPEAERSFSEDRFFCYDRRPKSERRGWQDVHDICKYVSIDEAIHIGRETAKKENIALYLSRLLDSVIDWHPEGWEPRSELPATEMPLSDHIAYHIKIG